MAVKLSTFDRFYNYLSDLQQSYDRLSDILTRKIDAAARFDINVLEAVMKEEQAYVLLSRGFDSNIATYREKLSLKGATLKEQIEELPAEEQARFRIVADKLKSSVDRAKALNDQCQTLIESKLYAIDKNLKELSQTNPGAYNKAAAQTGRAPSAPHLLIKSV